MSRHFLAVGLLAAAIGCDPGAIKESKTGEYTGAIKIYALKYGESLYPSRLVNTDSTEKNIRLNWLAYLVEYNGKKVLVDCGFSEPRLLRRFGIQKFRAVTTILSDLHIAPEQIDTIILTHTHFDHALDADKFPRAHVIVHGRELREPEEAALKPVFRKLAAAQRLQGVDSSIPWGPFNIEPVQGHTKGSLVIRLNAPGRHFVFSGDECYFAASCRKKIPLPPGAVYSSAANRAFMENLPPQAVVLTGHETDLKDGRWLNNYGFLFF